MRIITLKQDHRDDLLVDLPEPTRIEDDGHILTEFYFINDENINVKKLYKKSINFNLNLSKGEIRFIQASIPPFSHVKKFYDTSTPIKDILQHQTSTIDFVTIVDGTVTLIIADKEILLKKGDVVIQNNTKHAWHNYSKSKVCLISVVMVGLDVKV